MDRGLLACLILSFVQTTAGAWTIDPQPSAEAPTPTAYAAQRSISLAQATQLAVQRYPGQVVRAETVNRGGRSEHHIRILGPDGRVRTVRIDAQTGAFL